MSHVPLFDKGEVRSLYNYFEHAANEEDKKGLGKIGRGVYVLGAKIKRVANVLASTLPFTGELKWKNNKVVIDRIHLIARGAHLNAQAQHQIDKKENNISHYKGLKEVHAAIAAKKQDIEDLKGLKKISEVILKEFKNNPEKVFKNNEGDLVKKSATLNKHIDGTLKLLEDELNELLTIQKGYAKIKNAQFFSRLEPSVENSDKVHSKLEDLSRMLPGGVNSKSEATQNQQIKTLGQVEAALENLNNIENYILKSMTPLKENSSKSPKTQELYKLASSDLGKIGEYRTELKIAKDVFIINEQIEEISQKLDEKRGTLTSKEYVALRFELRNLGNFITERNKGSSFKYNDASVEALEKLEVQSGLRKEEDDVLTKLNQSSNELIYDLKNMASKQTSTERHDGYLAIQNEVLEYSNMVDEMLQQIVDEMQEKELKDLKEQLKVIYNQSLEDSAKNFEHNRSFETTIFHSKGTIDTLTKLIKNLKPSLENYSALAEIEEHLDRCEKNISEINKTLSLPSLSDQEIVELDNQLQILKNLKAELLLKYEKTLKKVYEKKLEDMTTTFNTASTISEKAKGSQAKTLGEKFLNEKSLLRLQENVKQEIKTIKEKGLNYEERLKYLANFEELDLKISDFLAQPNIDAQEDNKEEDGKTVNLSSLPVSKRREMDEQAKFNKEQGLGASEWLFSEAVDIDDEDVNSLSDWPEEKMEPGEEQSSPLSEVMSVSSRTRIGRSEEVEQTSETQSLDVESDQEKLEKFTYNIHRLGQDYEHKDISVSDAKSKSIKIHGSIIREIISREKLNNGEDKYITNLTKIEAGLRTFMEKELKLDTWDTKNWKPKTTLADKTIEEETESFSPFDESFPKEETQPLNKVSTQLNRAQERAQKLREQIGS